MVAGSQLCIVWWRAKTSSLKRQKYPVLFRPWQIHPSISAGFNSFIQQWYKHLSSVLGKCLLLWYPAGRHDFCPSRRLVPLNSMELVCRRRSTRSVMHCVEAVHMENSFHWNLPMPGWTIWFGTWTKFISSSSNLQASISGLSSLVTSWNAEHLGAPDVLPNNMCWFNSLFR